MISPIKKSVGGLVASFEGSGKTYGEVIRELAYFPDARMETFPDILYRFQDTPAIPGSESPDVERWNNFFFNVHGLRGNPVEITLSPAFPSMKGSMDIFPAFFQKIAYGLATRKASTNVQFFSDLFFYTVFLGCTHFLLMGKGASFIHASAVADANNEAYIFAGPRSSGKTAILLHLLSGTPYRFLSDDMLIVDGGGYARFYGRGILINSHALGMPEELKARFEKTLSFAEKITAVFRRPFYKRLFLRELLDGNRCAQKAAVKYNFYLLRGNAEQLTIRKMDVEEFSVRTALDIVSELKACLKYGPLFGFSDEPKILQESVASIYRNAFSNTECFELLIPFKISPADFGNSIRDFLAGPGKKGER